MKTDQINAVVIGASAGGIEALQQILPRLPKGYHLPIVIVLHIPSGQRSYLSELFLTKTDMLVKEADEKEVIKSGTIYFAPPGYHLLIERDFTFSLSTEESVHYSRPSIDVLFESAAEAFGTHLLGILLTGASPDGAAGLKRIQDRGGVALIQNPDTALARVMPEAARSLLLPLSEQVLSLEEIVLLLLRLKR